MALLSADDPAGEIKRDEAKSSLDTTSAVEARRTAATRSRASRFQLVGLSPKQLPDQAQARARQPVGGVVLPRLLDGVLVNVFA